MRTEPIYQVEKLEITPLKQGALKRNVWGYHLIVEFWNSPFELLAKAKTVEEALKSALSSLNKNNEIRSVSYQFKPFGVSAQASSGRISVYIHTWPESGYSAIDIISENKEQVYKVLEKLQKFFQPKYVYIAELVRGISEDWGET